MENIIENLKDVPWSFVIGFMITMIAILFIDNRSIDRKDK